MESGDEVAGEEAAGGSEDERQKMQRMMNSAYKVDAQLFTSDRRNALLQVLVLSIDQFIT